MSKDQPPESTFQERLSRAVIEYERGQRKDGGWGEDHFDGAPSSIVNTVEVLAVLRAGGVRYGEDTVEKAMRYLSKAVYTHPAPERQGDALKGPPRITGDSAAEEARGEFTRYCAWGLSGLTLYKESRHDERFADAQLHCITWLRDHMWTDAGPWHRVQAEGLDTTVVGAWGETPEAKEPSLLSTSAAISGLSRMCPRHRGGRAAEGLVRRARSVVRSRAKHPDGLKGMAFWVPPGGDLESEGTVATTAMAVISLAGGDAQDRSCSEEGARWLLSCKDRWENLTETDSNVPHANWQHMTFSLALRAVLRGARLPSNDPTLSPVVSHLHGLWLDEVGEWAHGDRLRASPSGSYAVVAAYEAMANAWPFDAQRQILEATSAARRSSKPFKLHVHVTREGLNVMTPVDGSEVGVPLRPKLAQIALAVARDGEQDGDLGSRSIALPELAAKFPEVEPESIKRNARDISARVKEESLKEGKPIGDIVQVMNDTALGGKRIRINVERVTYVGGEHMAGSPSDGSTWREPDEQGVQDPPVARQGRSAS